MGTSTQSKSSCKTAAVMNLLGRGAADRVLPAQPKEPQPRDIEVITREIKTAVRAAGENILTVGRGLIEVKEQLSHGDWLLWLEREVNFSEATAQNYMKLARRFSNPETFRDLGYSKALVLLSLPEYAMAEYIEVPHMVNGEEKTVADMSVRELKAALIKERDAALKAAEEAKAEQSAAELAREKMEQDMAVAKQLLEAAQAERDSAVQDAQRHEKALAESARNVVRLEKKLEELRSRPVDVAVEADAAAIEAARKEAEAAMQAELDKVKKDHAEDEKARKAAEEAKTAAQQELEKAQAEVRSIREQMEKARKKAAITANEDLVLFRVLFDQTQEQINKLQDQMNKLGGIVMKVRNKDPEKVQGLVSARMALCERIKEVAQV